MTEPEATPETPTPKPAGLVDLSDLRMMPAWVAGMSAPSNLSKYEEREDRGPRRDGGPDRRSGDRRGGPPPRRDGGGFGGAPGGGQNRDRGEFRPRRDGPPGQGGGPRRDDRGGPRRFGDRDRGPERPQREWVEIPKDIKVVIEPEDKAAEALANHIRSSGHAFSMFDAARLILAEGDRFHARFSCAPERPTGLFVTPADGGLFLSREEALSHVLRSPAIETYYRAEEVELEEPKGDFKSIGICGMTGELLGPPSHHSFQATLLRLHRERFANMPLEEYKRRVRTETSPERVAEWKEKQRKGQRWIYIKDQPQAAAPVAVESAPAPAPVEDAEAALEEGAEAPEAAPEAAPETAAPAVIDSPDLVVLSSRAEMEAHFRRTHSEDAVLEGREVVIPGSQDKSKITHILGIMMRSAVEGARKHLFEMSQKLGGGFERRGLKLFKRRAGKLFVCRMKPRAIDPGVVFSERVAKIVEVLKTTPGMPLAQLVEAIVPSTAPVVEGEAKPQLTDDQISVLKDLRWLTNEGYVIEYSDGMVFLGVQGEPHPAAPKEKGADKTKAASAEEAPEAPDATAASEETPAVTTEVAAIEPASLPSETEAPVIEEVTDPTIVETVASAPETETESPVAAVEETPASAPEPEPEPEPVEAPALPSETEVPVVEEVTDPTVVEKVAESTDAAAAEEAPTVILPNPEEKPEEPKA
ncbi:hypothetical protein WJU23_09575 [Prosthecobacter sp. SYSU 5D2]|uniref:hypothetical protein n=1 Tax=Prosthecobacter sp. SYSU 5D2 TaxID=3134134 RepID=UPI0031FE6705